MAKFVLVVLLFAGLVYALLWTLERRRAGGGRRVRGGKPTMRQVAPDDDEDFLRWLDRKQRRPEPPRDGKGTTGSESAPPERPADAAPEQPEEATGDGTGVEPGRDADGDPA